MAYRRTLLSRWRCWRFRAALAECAAEDLEVSRGDPLGRHLEACAHCREELAWLQKLSADLRRIPPPVVADEAFWRRQRQDIMRAVRSRGEAPAVSAGWRAGLAVAAAAVVAVAGYQMTRLAPRRPAELAAEIDKLDAPAQLAFLDVAELLVSPHEAWPEAASPGSEPAALIEDGWEALLPEFQTMNAEELDDDELDRLGEIVGDIV